MEYQLLSADHPIRRDIRVCVCVCILVIKGDRLGVTGNREGKKYSVLTATITITIATNFDFLHHGLFRTRQNDVTNDDLPLERVFFSRTRIERENAPSIVAHRYETNAESKERLLSIDGTNGLVSIMTD